MNLRLRTEHLQHLQRIPNKIIQQTSRIENPVPQAFELYVDDVFYPGAIYIIACCAVVFEKEVCVADVNLLLHLFGHECHFFWERL